MCDFRRKPSLALEEFCQLLRSIRLDMGLSQRKFAALVGVKQAHIWKWERGVVLPTAQSMGKLMAHSSVSFEVMFSELAQIYTRDLYEQVKESYDVEVRRKYGSPTRK